MPKIAQQRPSRNLQRLRVEAGLSQRALAALAGVGATSIRHAETGSVPRPPAQRRIAAALTLALELEITATDLWPFETPNGMAA